MLPLTRNLVVADGQLGSSAAAIQAGTGDVARRFNFTFSNSSASATETIVLSYSRNGGTRRQLRQVVLDPGETAELTGLAINKADAVYAVATDAATVDYLVSQAADEAPLCWQVYDANGLPKSYPYIYEQLAAVFG